MYLSTITQSLSPMATEICNNFIYSMFLLYIRENSENVSLGFSTFHIKMPKKISNKNEIFVNQESSFLLESMGHFDILSILK